MQRILWLAWGIALGFAAVAHAGDGRIEIHQACVPTGCGSGDAGGFPVSFSSGGSFVLTSDLEVPDANTTAVSLPARSTLDLNGFTIRGCRVLRNGGTALGLGAGSPNGSLVERNVIYANGGVGLSTNVGNGEAACGHDSFRSSDAGGAQVSGGQSLGNDSCGNGAC